MDLTNIIEVILQTHNVPFFTSVLAFIIFSFMFWRDSTLEGFSSNKIFDTLVLVTFFAFLGGKVLFRELSYNYFRYEFLSSPIIFEGSLLAGGVTLFIVVNKNKWSIWKIGDMVTPALTFFQSIVFLGIYYITRSNAILVLSIAFGGLYLFLRYLKSEKKLGQSKAFFVRKRLRKFTFTGALFSVYLTGSSVIAILFLVNNIISSSWFWWFQLLFYFSILFVSIVTIQNRISKYKVDMSVIKYVKNLLPFKKPLNKRKNEIDSGLKNIEENDPFVREHDVEGTRNIDSVDEEVADTVLHEQMEVEKEELLEEKEEVQDALDKIERGTYGIDEKTGKPISKKRLEANPTARYSIETRKKLESEGKL